MVETKMDGEVEAGNMDLAVPGAGNRMKWVKKIGRYGGGGVQLSLIHI